MMFSVGQQRFLGVVLAVVMASPMAGVPNAHAQSSAAQVEGSWQTAFRSESRTIDIPLTLRQTGEVVNGTYANESASGVLSGRLYGRVLRGRWVEGESVGGVRLVFSEDGQSFSGTWGNGDSSTNGGAWNGEREGD